MANDKQPCIHCGMRLDPSARSCPECGSPNPFSLGCPQCLHTTTKDDATCPGCGRELYVTCPHCGKRTFVQDVCEQCGKSLMVRCTNSHCGAMQFFENKHCNVCGKKMKVKTLV